MLNYCCQTCGKRFDPERTEICPNCGTAAAPSVITRIERKQTAARLRAEGMTHYDDHCHEDDAWKGSYGAQSHRAAVRSHEANLRASYRAHDAADVTVRDAGPAQAEGSGRKQEKRQRSRFGLILLFALLPALLTILGKLISSVLELLQRLLGGFGSLFP